MPPSHLLPIAVLVAALLGAPASPATAATRTVAVADGRYSPQRLSVAKGTRIEWVWSNRNSHVHDVYLDRRPRGAGRFHSRPASRSFSFRRKLRRAGRYTILCTFHEDMRMRIDVGGR